MGGGTEYETTDRAERQEEEKGPAAKKDGKGV